MYCDDYSCMLCSESERKSENYDYIAKKLDLQYLLYTIDTVLLTGHCQLLQSAPIQGTWDKTR